MFTQHNKISTKPMTYEATIEYKWFSQNKKQKAKLGFKTQLAGG